jgi:hypothetical protein
MFLVDAGNDRIQIANLLLGEISSNVDIIQSTSSDGLLIDVTGELILDADVQGSGNGVLLKDGGTHYGSFFRSSSDFHIKAEAQDEDMIFMGNDGGTEITVLTLDMSQAGKATFNTALSDNTSLTTHQTIKVVTLHFLMPLTLQLMMMF